MPANGSNKFCLALTLVFPKKKIELFFSLAEDEKDRLVRAWISSQGQSVHLEIDNHEIFSYPTFIEEHRWYHICQSWTNVNGRYGLWIDGQKAVDGYATKVLSIFEITRLNIFEKKINRRLFMKINWHKKQSLLQHLARCSNLLLWLHFLFWLPQKENLEHRARSWRICKFQFAAFFYWNFHSFIDFLLFLK